MVQAVDPPTISMAVANRSAAMSILLLAAGSSRSWPIVAEILPRRSMQERKLLPAVGLRMRLACGYPFWGENHERAFLVAGHSGYSLRGGTRRRRGHPSTLRVELGQAGR